MPRPSPCPIRTDTSWKAGPISTSYDHVGTANEWAFGPICPDFKVHRINGLETNNRSRLEIFGGYQSNVEEGSGHNARLRGDMPDSLRGFCSDSIQAVRSLPGGPGEQEDL